MRIALVVGVSGKLGKAVIDALLNNKHYKKIIVLTRHDHNRFKNIHLKKVKVNFSAIADYQDHFSEVDDVFCLLGKDYINTKKLEDAHLFEYQYPYDLAKVASEAGVKNFYIVNPISANLEASKLELRERAQLAADIATLAFPNFLEFKVNRLRRSVNTESSFFAARKSFRSIMRIFGSRLNNKFQNTPANLLANKMIELALSNPLGKKVFLPSDY